jgi:hypothetical protein
MTYIERSDKCFFDDERLEGVMEEKLQAHG